MATFRRILGWFFLGAFISFPVTGVFMIFSLDELITGKDISWDSQEGPSFVVVFILGVFVVGLGLACRFMFSSTEIGDTPTPSVTPSVLGSIGEINQTQQNEGSLISKSEPHDVVAPIQKNKRKIIID